MKHISSMAKRKFFTVIAHVLFCAIIILIFGKSCMIRPASYPYLYKEYLSGVFVLAATYTNILILYPFLFRKNRKSLYVIFSLLVTFLAAFAEIALVYPQIHDLLAIQVGIQHAQKYIVESLAFVWLRNIGFSSFAFMICEIYHLAWQNQENERVLVNQHSQLMVQAKDNSAEFINTKDICYGLQHGNYTEIHMCDGNLFHIYSTLSKLLEKLDADSFVCISRSCFVAYSAVCKYDQFHVEMKVSHQKTPEILYISRRMSEKTTLLLQKHASTAKDKNSTTSVHDPDASALLRKNKNYSKIYHVIAQKPNCTVKEIRKQVKLSPNSLYRYISVLKQQGLIRHVGSNKTGGYEAVEGGLDGA